MKVERHSTRCSSFAGGSSLECHWLIFLFRIGGEEDWRNKRSQFVASTKHHFEWERTSPVVIKSTWRFRNATVDWRHCFPHKQLETIERWRLVRTGKIDLLTENKFARVFARIDRHTLTRVGVFHLFELDRRGEKTRLAFVFNRNWLHSGSSTPVFDCLRYISGIWLHYSCCLPCIDRRNEVHPFSNRAQSKRTSKDPREGAVSVLRTWLPPWLWQGKMPAFWLMPFSLSNPSESAQPCPSFFN